MGSARMSSNLIAVVEILRVSQHAKMNSWVRVSVWVHPVGFEPTPPKGTELESVALDHSATDAVICYTAIANSEIRTRDLLFTKQMH